MRVIPIRSLSLSLWESNYLPTDLCRVLGVFHHAVDLALGSDVIALVTPELHNGPFHITIDTLPYWAPSSQIPYNKSIAGFTLGDWQLEITPESQIWDAQPNWDAIQVSSTMISYLQKLYQVEIHRRYINLSIPNLFQFAPFYISTLREGILYQCRHQVEQSVMNIAGLGIGLTPSGDDFLSGVMLASHTFHFPMPKNEAEVLRSWIFDAAAPRTNFLSRAYLKYARDGLADEHWHDLVYSLSSNNLEKLLQTAHAVWQFGETSGLDMLSGFLWMAEIALSNQQQ